MFAVGSVTIEPLLLFGALYYVGTRCEQRSTLAIAVTEGQHERSTHVVAGLALVLIGYLLRAADTLGWLPDVLTRGVDDEDAVATMPFLTALLLGGVLILKPVAGSADPSRYWAFDIFALFGLVLLVAHVVTTFSLED